MTRIRSLSHPDWSLALLGLGLALSSLLPAPAGAASEETTRGPLDDKTYAVELGKVGQEEGDADDLVFVNGTFRSTACDPYGFTTAPYEAMPKEDGIHFKAIAKSPTDGTMTWMGRVEDDRIEGTAVWRRDGKGPVEHWFKGSIKSMASK